MDLMGMVDVDMESAAKRKTCEQRLKELDDEWKRKMNDIMREFEKITIKKANEQITKIKQECNDRMRALGERCKAKIKTVMDLANDRHRSAMTVVRQENARLKAENARLAEAVARTAAAMTLSGMPKKRRRPGFRDLGNPSMW